MQDSNVSAAVSPGMVGDTSEGPPQSALTRLSPLLRRVIADNRSPFTFTGTCSYIVGEGKVAIVDPGPADHPAHLAALLDAVRGESVSHIVVTHTHRDHSPAARALKAATGAPISKSRRCLAVRSLAPRNLAQRWTNTIVTPMSAVAVSRCIDI